MDPSLPVDIFSLALERIHQGRPAEGEQQLRSLFLLAEGEPDSAPARDALAMALACSVPGLRDAAWQLLKEARKAAARQEESAVRRLEEVREAIRLAEAEQERLALVARLQTEADPGRLELVTRLREDRARLHSLQSESAARRATIRSTLEIPDRS